ncbi:MAG: peptide chain release factor N(5)-glutamine methyltransferase [Myxococcales bacterium]|nr:peptide chain release factor N(5)-glutamine methyltransferase [Myxococcales bacterium]MDH3845123.1 peptide chain release factor N(5)-glutamine methyltransferase [Myxococcales bacterium]
MTSRTWTIHEVLEWTTSDFASRQIATPRLDAELLVAEALGIDRVGLYLDLNRPLVDDERASIRALVSRRRDREPVAYILGYRDFYGRRFTVDSSVLIPRPDTETLIGHALECIPKDTPFRVLDVGTGSGVIALTLAAERPLATVIGTDVSEEALCVASRNAAELGLGDRVRFVQAHLVDEGSEHDLVVSNPPYVTHAQMAELEPEVRDYEPSLALEAGKDGLDVVRMLLVAAAPVTRAGAQMLIEVGQDQAGSVLALAERSDAWAPVGTHLDLNRIERVVHLRRT